MWSRPRIRLDSNVIPLQLAGHLHISTRKGKVQFAYLCTKAIDYTFCNFSMNQDTVRQSEHHTLHWDNIPAKIEKISSYNAVYSFLCLLAHACVFENQRDTALIYVHDDLHKLCTRCVWNSLHVAALGFH